MGFLVLLLASAFGACAQVTVQLELEQDQFLPGEQIRVAVRIVNRSGQTLHLGTGEDWLRFSAESSAGQPVPKFADPPVAGEFELESSKRGTKRVDLEPCFAFNQLGRYGVTATVKIKDWSQQLVSPPAWFNIIEGTKFWEQEFGVPLPDGSSNAPPEVRKYILQQANYLKNQLRLYLRVTDAAGSRVVRTRPVGLMLGFSRPQPKVDKLSNLHLLYQNWAKSFSYTVYNPDGEIVTRQTYDYIGERPHLQTDDSGGISVLGGERRVTDNDIPAPAAAPEHSAVAPHDTEQPSKPDTAQPAKPNP